MIKPTFYNLSDDKRKRVLQAILEEFADTDSEKISINRIIAVAEYYLIFPYAFWVMCNLFFYIFISGVKLIVVSSLCLLQNFFWRYSSFLHA